MKKRTKITLVSAIAGAVALGAVAAVAGPVIYRDLIVGEVAAPPTVSSSGSPGSAPPRDDMASQLASEWRVTDGSFAGYRVDEVLNGTDVTVVGRTDRVTGTLSIDNTTRSLTSAEIEVDIASVSTDSANRDAYFRDTTMRAGEHPTATFRLTDPLTAPRMLVEGEAQKVSATGELTLAGRTQQVTVEIEAVLNGTTGQVAGSIPITFADFGIDAPSLGFVSVEKTGSVEFSLVLEPA